MYENEVFAISDLHFGHKNIIRYCDRPFASVEQMNEIILERLNARGHPARAASFA